MELVAMLQQENEDLRRRLREAEDALRSAVENPSDWECWTDASGRLRICSRACEHITGRAAAEFLADPDLRARLVHPADRARFDEHVRDVEDRRGAGEGEWRFLRPDGTACWVSHVCRPVFDAEGAYLGRRSSDRDIAARKQAEAALRESERRFRQVTESLPQLVWTCRPDGPCDYLGPQWVHYTGIAESPQLGYGWLEQVHPDDRERAIAAWQSAAAAGRDFAVEFRIRRHDGAYRWFRTLAVPLRDGTGNIVRWFGSNTDIQDIKEAGLAERESEDRLRFALEMSHTGAWDLDLVDLTAQRSLEHDRIFGYGQSLPRWTYEMFLDHVLPEDRPTVDVKFREATGKGGDWSFECRIRRVDGEVRWIWAALRHRTDVATGRCRLTGIVQDITDRRQAEEMARIQLLEIEDIYRSAPVGLCVLDRDLRYIRINERLAEINGVPAAAHIGRLVRDVLPELARVVEPEMRRVLETGEPRLNVEVVSETPAQPGVRRSWLEQWLPITDTEGRVTRLSIVVEETTERKRAETALREQRLLLETIVNDMPAAVALIRGSDLRLEFVNPAYRAIAPGVEMVGRTLDELWHDTGQDFAAICRRVLETGEPHQTIDELNMIRREPGGTLEPRYFSWGLHRVRLPDGDGWGLVVAAWETTARVAVEDDLRRAEAERKVAQAVRTERQRLFDVLETLPAAICLLTRDYHVAFANRRFRDTFGESLGRHCYEYCFGQPAPCEFCRTYDVLATGKPQQWEVTTLSGRVIDVHDLPFTDVDGSPLILEMELDITERRRVEDELRQAHGDLAERAAQLRALAGELTLSEQRERRRLARILHDHLQQLLVAAKYRTAALGMTVDEAARLAAAEVEQLIDTCIGAARRLTAEISPPFRQEAGLPERFRWLAGWMAAQHGLHVNLAIADDVPAVGEDVRILLFESVRELLFNVAKHARVDAADVVVDRAPDGALRITVSDSGGGFNPAKLRISSESGVGFGLFSIRERLELLGGRMEIDSAPGSGSRFALTAPADHLVAQAPAAAHIPAGPSARDPARRKRPNRKPTIRVLIADDHEVVREGLRRLLYEEKRIRLVGEAADGREAVELADRLQPDVILMDVSMPRLGGVEATRAIRSHRPGTRIIGISMFDDEDRAQAMLDAGAVAYLSKGSPARDLIDAIRRASPRPSKPRTVTVKARRARRNAR